VRPRHDLTPSLFDDAPAPIVDAVEALDDDELDEWREVPQALFLSWSPLMQLHYCWQRDMDSALRADNNTDAQFYLTRAASYKEMLETAKEKS
jgi:hypothetical protein